jgi:fructokinase
MGHKLGIDLGGTKTEVVVLDPEGQTVYRQRVTTPADSYDAILDLISRLVRAAETELGLHVSVGIGIPGAISPRAGLLRNSNTVCMNGRPFASDLEASLEREVRIENDANCFGVARGGGTRPCLASLSAPAPEVAW